MCQLTPKLIYIYENKVFCTTDTLWYRGILWYIYTCTLLFLRHLSTLDNYSRFFTLDSRLFTLDVYSRLSTFTLDSRLFTLDYRHLLSTLDPRVLDTLDNF